MYVHDLCFANITNVYLDSCDPISKLDKTHPTFTVSVNIGVDNVLSKHIDWYFKYALAEYSEKKTFMLKFKWL